MIRSDFPVFSRYPDLVYLDSTASAQKPRMVIDGMKDFMEGKYANIHRGAYALSEMAEMTYELSRQKACAIIGARETSEIFYTYNATYGMNLIAETLRLSGEVTSGDVILTSAIEHHANLVPWFLCASQSDSEVKVTHLKNGSFDYEGFEEAMTEQVKVVTVTGASNVTGEIIDLERIHAMILRKFPGEKKTYFIVDATQLVPHMTLDVVSLDIDLLVFTGHKVMTDTGLGVVYGKKSLLQKFTPSFGGGGAINHVSHDGFIPAGLPSRWEPGTPHIIGAASLLYALEYIESIGGYEKIEEVERDLVEYVWEKLEHFAPLHEGKVQLIGGGREIPRIGVFSFYTPEIHVSDLAESFAEKNIAVRSGHHCAEPLHEENAIPASIRISLYIYNTREDIDRFFEVFEQECSEL